MRDEDKASIHNIHRNQILLESSTLYEEDFQNLSVFADYVQLVYKKYVRFHVDTVLLFTG